MSVGWCSPRYIRDSATMTGMTIAGIRNRYRHQPRKCPMTRIAMATYRQHGRRLVPGRDTPRWAGAWSRWVTSGRGRMTTAAAARNARELAEHHHGDERYRPPAPGDGEERPRRSPRPTMRIAWVAPRVLKIPAPVGQDGRAVGGEPVRDRPVAEHVAVPVLGDHEQLADADDERRGSVPRPPGPRRRRGPSVRQGGGQAL